MKKISKLIFPILLIFALVLTGCKNQIMDGPGMVNSENPSTELTNFDYPYSDEGYTVQKGSAVIYDNKLLFRFYLSPSVEAEGIFGDFSTTLYPYEGNELYTYDIGNPDSEAEFLCKDNGYGDLYLIGNTLYSQAMSQSGSSYVYSKDLPSGSEKKLFDGEITDFSPDGKTFIVQNYDADGISYSAYNTYPLSLEYQCFKADSSYSHALYLGMTDDNAFFLVYGGENHFYVYQYSSTGAVSVLCEYSTDPANDLGYDKDFTYNETDKTITFTLNFYQGSGHFYYSSDTVTVRINESASGSTTPMYEPEVVNTEGEEDPAFLERNELEKYATEFPNVSGCIQRVQKNIATTEYGRFFVIAESHRYPFEDIGWRYCYQLLNMHYMFEPNDKSGVINLKDMFQPGGSYGKLDDIAKYYEQAPSITVLASVVGSPDGDVKGILYQTVRINGVDIEEPVEYGTFYFAEVSDDLYYEHTVNGDIYSWEMGRYNDWIADIKQYPDNFRIGTPDNLAGFDGYDIEDSFSADNAFFWHLGFDREGKIDYIRPIIFD